MSSEKSREEIMREKKKRFEARFGRKKKKGRKKPSKKEVKIEKFWKSFRSKVSTINSMLEDSRVEFEKVNTLQTDLMNFFSTNLRYLKPYDKKQGNKMVSDLKKRIEGMSQKGSGDSGFSFISESKEVNQEENSSKVEQDSESNIPEFEVTFDLTISEVNNSEKRVKNLTKDEFFLITECEGSTLRLECASGTGYFKKLKKCKISVGPVSRSVFIQNCEDCVFSVACRQFRARNCKNCDFYIHVNSTPVIENSSGIRVAKYDYSLYETVENDFKEADLDRDQNQWDQIQDFHWQRKEKSPNWCILDDKKEED